MNEPSAYQEAVFDFVQYGQGNAVVNAVAGSGKTWTLVQSAKRIGRFSRATFAAFNCHIRDDVKGKLWGTPMSARTVNGIGHGILCDHLGKDIVVRENKYKSLAQSALEAEIGAKNLHKSTLDEFVDLLKFTRLTLTSPSDETALQEVIARFNLKVPGGLLSLVKSVLESGERQAADEKVIDYEDQLWLPHVWKLAPPQCDWLFVDESQDLSSAAQELLLRSGARYLFVGDPAQSIMAFAGADQRSYFTIRERAEAIELPLSICYRCPRSHLRIARKLVPHIEARPDASEGQLLSLPERDLAAHARRGDLIICRRTAPLIGWCIALNQQGIPSRVRGEDVSKSLLRIVERLAQTPGFRFERFEGLLAEYEAEQVERLSHYAFSKGRVEALHDCCDAVLKCSMEAYSLEELKDYIAFLFDVRCENPVSFSTVHRAKGSQARRVFILQPHKLPLEWPDQQRWEWKQELNLRYVAVTRATENLVLLQSEGMRVDYTDDWLEKRRQEKWLTKGWR